MYRKGMVLGIIVLFIGAGIIPGLSGENNENVGNISGSIGNEGGNDKEESSILMGPYITYSCMCNWVSVDMSHSPPQTQFLIGEPVFSYFELAGLSPYSLWYTKWYKNDVFWFKSNNFQLDNPYSTMIVSSYLLGGIGSVGSYYVEAYVNGKYIGNAPDFTVYINQPPNTPSNAIPGNHNTDVDVNADLSWLGGDPDSGDTVSYYVFFGKNSNPPLKKAGLTSTSYDPGTLSSNTKYYWVIVAKDNHGAITEGPVWDFTTGGNQAPVAYIDYITPNPANKGETVSFSGHGVDDDGSITAYNWGSSIDGQLSTSSSFSTSSLSVGTHTIYFKVKDNDSEWSDKVTKTLTINPRDQFINYLEWGYSWGFHLSYSSDNDLLWGAQSFKPTMPTLTRIKLLLYRAGDVPCDLIVSIRDNINGNDLVSVSKNPEEIMGVFQYPEWVEFDFQDISVNVNETYYIVIRSYCGNISKYYCPMGTLDNLSNYSRGELWYTFSLNGGWSPIGTDDLYFETYGSFVELPSPRLEVSDITGGFRVSAVIKNNGTGTAYDVNWSIDLEGGLILVGAHTEGVIDELPPGATETIRQTTLYGIGRTTITVTVSDATKTATGFMLGPLVLGVEEIS